MKKYDFTIQKDYESIYFFLKEAGFSENFIKNLRKKEGFLKINNEIVFMNHPLNKDDVLSIVGNPNTSTSIMHCILPLDIVYEDDYYLLLNKPSGLSSMPNKSHYTHNLAGAICHYLHDNEFTLRIVNRLDKDTAGLLLVAKDSIALNVLKDFKKIYHAICCGEINKDLVVDKPILTITENGVNQNKRVLSHLGKRATTFVHPIKTNGKYTLTELKLINGRTHQIRVHLSSIDHPLLGDCLYGSPSNLIDHTALLCKKISFYHPFLNQTMTFEIDYPDDFRALLKEL